MLHIATGMKHLLKKFKKKGEGRRGARTPERQEGFREVVRPDLGLGGWLKCGWLKKRVTSQSRKRPEPHRDLLGDSVGGGQKMVMGRFGEVEATLNVDVKLKAIYLWQWFSNTD
jgi:hypothetical protein